MVSVLKRSTVASLQSYSFRLLLLLPKFSISRIFSIQQSGVDFLSQAVAMRDPELTRQFVCVCLHTLFTKIIADARDIPFEDAKSVAVDLRVAPLEDFMSQPSSHNDSSGDATAGAIRSARFPIAVSQGVGWS